MRKLSTSAAGGRFSASFHRDPTRFPPADHGKFSSFPPSTVINGERKRLGLLHLSHRVFHIPPPGFHQMVKRKNPFPLVHQNIPRLLHRRIKKKPARFAVRRGFSTNSTAPTTTTIFIKIDFL